MVQASLITGLLYGLIVNYVPQLHNPVGYVIWMFVLLVMAVGTHNIYMLSHDCTLVLFNPDRFAPKWMFPFHWFSTSHGVNKLEPR